jgi:hypothetical protein
MRLHNQLDRGTTVPSTGLRRSACQPRAFSRFRDGTFSERSGYRREGPLRKATGCPLKVTLMSLGTILVILLILILLGVIPRWGYSNSWGYGPSGIVGTILIIVVILLLLGRI